MYSTFTSSSLPPVWRNNLSEGPPNNDCILCLSPSKNEPPPMVIYVLRWDNFRQARSCYVYWFPFSPRALSFTEHSFYAVTIIYFTEILSGLVWTKGFKGWVSLSSLSNLHGYHLYDDSDELLGVSFLKSKLYKSLALSTYLPISLSTDYKKSFNWSLLRS